MWKERAIARVCRGGKRAVGGRPKKLHVVDAGVADHSGDSDIIATVLSLRGRGRRHTKQL